MDRSLSNTRKISLVVKLIHRLHFRPEDKYVLALVPKAFENLRVVPINERNAKLEDNLLENLGFFRFWKTLNQLLKT